MSKAELEAELSDLKARYLATSDKRRLKQIRERIDHVAELLRLISRGEQ
jgi:hypothetical protein